MYNKLFSASFVVGSKWPKRCKAKSTGTNITAQ